MSQPRGHATQQRAPRGSTRRPDAQARRITLRIEPGGRALKLTVPKGIKERDINDFLARNGSIRGVT